MVKGLSKFKVTSIEKTLKDFGVLSRVVKISSDTYKVRYYLEHDGTKVYKNMFTAIRDSMCAVYASNSKEEISAKLDEAIKYFVAKTKSSQKVMDNL